MTKIQDHKRKLAVEEFDNDLSDGDDIHAEVIDPRIHKQIENMINEDLKTIKKGSVEYLKAEA